MKFAPQTFPWNMQRGLFMLFACVCMCPNWVLCDLRGEFLLFQRPCNQVRSGRLVGGTVYKSAPTSLCRETRIATFSQPAWWIFVFVCWNKKGKFEGYFYILCVNYYSNLFCSGHKRFFVFWQWLIYLVLGIFAVRIFMIF